MRVAVIGGGLAGLAASRDLAHGGADVIVYEAATVPGGQVRTETVHEFRIEHGAEGFSTRADATIALCEELGIEAEIVPQRPRTTLLLRDGVLERLGEGAAGRILGIQADPTAFGAGLLTLRGGMGALVTALHESVRAGSDVRLATVVTALEPMETGWTVASTGGDETVDAVILTLPAISSATLLEPVIGPCDALRRLPHRSSVTVSLAYPRDAVGHPLDATGFILPPEAPGRSRACTFASEKFPGRSPEDAVLLRVFLQATVEEFDRPDQAWRDEAVGAIATPLGIAGDPLLVRVTRWPGALPRHPEGFPHAVAAIEHRLAGGPPLLLAGAGIRGGGVDGAVRSGRATAASLRALAAR